MRFPSLDQIQDPATREALRMMWEELRTLEAREEVSEGLTATELTQLRTALQLSGSHPLNVGGLPGKLRGVQHSALIYHACWRKAATTAGAGTYDWDTLVFNSAPQVFVLQATNTEISVKAAGVYLVHARLSCLGSPAQVTLQLNASIVAQAILDDTDAADDFTGNLTHICALQPGDQLKCTSVGGQRSGDATLSGGTMLYIMKIA